MRAYEEYREILELWETGLPKKRIAITLGIPRATVRDCINRYGTIAELEEHAEQASKASPEYALKRLTETDDTNMHRAYAYVLGIYLGDGCLSKSRKVFRLRITLDKKYPGIIQYCSQAVQVLLPDNQVGVVTRKTGCVEVSCYYKHWPEILPQHGEGRKHTRPIMLEAWQQRIVDAYPLEFFRGLYHSDGSRFSNIVKGKDYPRYSFTNSSPDILDLFTKTCDTLAIHWTVKNRNRDDDHAVDIFISKRPDVEYLDSVIGPKC